MVVVQVFNRRIGAYVKIKKLKGKPSRIIAVKKIRPDERFKNVRLG